MNYSQAMDHIKQQAEKEEDPLLQFLLMPIEDTPAHVHYTAYVYGKFSKKLTFLEKEQELVKLELEELKHGLIKTICEKVNPQTLALYSNVYAEKVATLHPKVKNLKRVLLDLKYKALDIKRYLISIDKKVNMTPGAQGHYNRHTEAQENEENEG